MKRIDILLILLFGLYGLTGCDDHLDINTDPSYPGDSSVEMLLPSGIAWSAARLGSDMELIGGFWSQHYTQGNGSNQYNTLATYALTNSSYTGMWTALYAGALTDLKLIMEKAEATEQWDYYLVAKVMTAFDFHILIDFYETVPFTEALMGDQNVNPKYDDSKTVYTGILQMLDEAIAKKDAAKSSKGIESGDFVFGGDIDKWVTFAKTLKFKILMRDFDANQTQLAALIQEGDLLTTDARMNGFEDKENNSNPLYENDRRKLNTTNNIRMAKTLVEFLKENDDPRIADFCEEAKSFDGKDAPGFYNGLPYGNISVKQSESPTHYSSRARLAPEDPVYFLSEAESYFLRAEYYARVNDKTNAKIWYDKGVDAAFLRWGYTDAADFTGAGGVYEFDETNMMKSIITQKWVAATRCQAWDAFFDINRTGYPQLGVKQVGEEGYVSGELVPAADGVLGPGDLPRRLLIPKSSSDYNPNAPAVIPVEQKMWWHK